MRRAILHLGLSLAIVIAPAACCCQVGLFRQLAQAAATPGAQPEQAPPAESCCHKARSSCCHEPTPSPLPTEHKQPLPKSPESCACCNQQLIAAQTESKPTVAAPEPTGELLPFAALAAISDYPHRSGVDNLTGWYGVDARTAALFERHVLRC